MITIYPEFDLNLGLLFSKIIYYFPFHAQNIALCMISEKATLLAGRHIQDRNIVLGKFKKWMVQIPLTLQGSSKHAAFPVTLALTKHILRTHYKQSVLCIASGIEVKMLEYFQGVQCKDIFLSLCQCSSCLLTHYTHPVFQTHIPKFQYLLFLCHRLATDLTLLLSQP